MKDLLKPEIVWALVGVGLLIAEFAMPGLIVFFFALGALLVAILCVFIDLSLNAQLVVFLVGSVVLLLALRKWLRGMFHGHTVDTQTPTANLDGFVGQTAVARVGLEPGKVGKVDFHGADWQAIAEESIPEGATVCIVGRDNLTLKVESKK